MRLHRRGAIRLGLGVAGAAGLAALAGRHAFASGRGSDDITPIRIDAKPIPALLPADPERRRFGSLLFRSGLVLSSRFDGFGGLSALSRSPDGARLVSLSDNAQWLTAEVAYADGRLDGLAKAVMAPILGEDGTPLRHGRSSDTEAFAIAGEDAYVGIERTHEVRRFAWARDGIQARGAAFEVPRELAGLPSNAGLEALAVPPDGHPLAGSLVAIAEQARRGDDAPTRGWVLTGPRRFAFDVARRDGFDITDMVFLADGEALLLERRYTLLSGVACRIRRIAADAFRPDALVDGTTIFDVDRAYEVDNMEGIALHTDPGSGKTVLTLVSDDNFSPIQRTLLLEFEVLSA